MGWLSKLKKTWQAAKEIAPLLPIPQKAKTVIERAGHAEEDIAAIVDTVKKKPKPPQNDR